MSTIVEMTTGQRTDLDVQLSREWLLTNGRGGFASGTVVGVPTRRYHGLLVAAARPPLERWRLLSAMLERVTIDGQAFELPGFEFDGKFHPRGFDLQTQFELFTSPAGDFVQFDYDLAGSTLTKRVQLRQGCDETWIQYEIKPARSQAQVEVKLCPLVSMLDFHALRQATDVGPSVDVIDDFLAIDAFFEGPRLWLCAANGDGESAQFDSSPDWWRSFSYRAETQRGQDDHEDLFTPGWLCLEGTGQLSVGVRAVAELTGSRHVKPKPAVVRIGPGEPARAQPVERRLASAARAFVSDRQRADGSTTATILAGYPWFGDWGRDAMIALPGLLLETSRFTEAKEVLETFASAQQDGLIPNRFSDYGDGCDYNSVDASLWFVHAADAYCAAADDELAWSARFEPVCLRIVEAFAKGTCFNIRMDNDGLISCGDASTQLTWMDAKFGDIVFTPRHGKPVEINALWYHALQILVARLQSTDVGKARQLKALAGKVKKAFVKVFWNEETKCLNDVVRPDWADPAVRPNQVFAVSLPHSPLNATQCKSVLQAVEAKLLTTVRVAAERLFQLALAVA